MAPNLRVNTIAFISSSNHPIFIRTFAKQDEHAIKYHYIAHTSLDVIEERGRLPHALLRHLTKRSITVNSAKATDCYLGLLYAMEDVAVYGYITPLKLKIVLALALSDSVVKDVEITMVNQKLRPVLTVAEIQLYRFSKRCIWPTILPFRIPS
jgi:hypothetical protein